MQLNGQPSVSHVVGNTKRDISFHEAGKLALAKFEAKDWWVVVFIDESISPLAGVLAHMTVDGGGVAALELLRFGVGFDGRDCGDARVLFLKKDAISWAQLTQKIRSLGRTIPFDDEGERDVLSLERRGAPSLTPLRIFNALIVAGRTERN
jgi:hypothetical protein